MLKKVKKKNKNKQKKAMGMRIVCFDVDHQVSVNTNCDLKNPNTSFEWLLFL